MPEGIFKKPICVRHGIVCFVTRFTLTLRILRGYMDIQTDTK